MDYSKFKETRDTRKAWNLMTEVKANGLQFMKIIWQF